jgi:aminoglycoside 3'-phosphotransferase-1
MLGLLEGYDWTRDTVGGSGAAVYHLRKAGAPALYLKHGIGMAADVVNDEMIRLEWLGRRIETPAVVHFVRTPDQAWLLMTALPGRTANQMLEADPGCGPAITDALTSFMRRLHDLPTDECPFDASHEFRMACAWDRIAAGMIDLDDFDDEREGWTAEEVWNAMRGLLPFEPDRVVTHGDFSLDNFLIEEGAVVGCIDAGRVGIADRYQDVAILWNCLGKFDRTLQDRFLRNYGFADVDARKLRFHLMLDELF